MNQHIDNYIASVGGWLKKPFNENGNVIDWFLFLGLAAIIGYFWTRVLQRIGQ